jgi:hypothetical protein
MIFLDDILVYSKDLQSHITHLRVVFTVLRDDQFYFEVV